MKERIGEIICEKLSGIVPVYLSEAETEAYPYAVYTADFTPVRSKDEILKISADVVLSIVSNDFDSAELIADNAIGLLAELNYDRQFSMTLRGWSKTCSEGVWSIDMRMNINQYN